ncbi:MAG: hypothetical protein ACTSSA_15165 [Candidatus Freyarchaeota archaeon]
MWYVLEYDVPANTQKSSYKSRHLKASAGIIHSIIVTIPPGSGYLAGCQLLANSIHVLPRHKDTWITGEHVNVNYREWWELKPAVNDLELRAYNEDDTYSHRIRLLIGILPKAVMEIEEQYLKNLRTFMRLFRRREE